MQEFIPNTETFAVPSDPASTEPVREPIRMIVIGSAPGVDVIVKTLHRLQFAEVTAWSKPQIDPTSGKTMRVLTKWIRG